MYFNVYYEKGEESQTILVPADGEQEAEDIIRASAGGCLEVVIATREVVTDSARQKFKRQGRQSYRNFGTRKVRC